MNNVALEALADIRLAPSLAKSLAFDVGSARTLLKYWKPNLLRVLHPDVGGDKLQIDTAKVTASFDLLESLSDDELREVLRSYGSIFTDTTGTIIALKQQLSVEVPKLQTEITELRNELKKYQDNESWLIEQTIRDNDKFTVEVVDKIVQAMLVHSTPTKLANEFKVSEEVMFYEAPNKYLISELSPHRNGIVTDCSDEDSDIQYVGIPFNGFSCMCLVVDRYGRTSVSNMSIFPKLSDEELKKEPPTEERDYDLSLRDLDELLQESLEDNEHISTGHSTIVTGVLLGFLNAAEAEEATDEELLKDLSSHFITKKVLKLRDISDQVLPLLSNNALIREQIDPVNKTKLSCRIRLYDPKNTYVSTYAVVLSSTQEVSDWMLTFVPLGMSLEK